MGSCHVAHDCQIGSHNIFANGTLLAGHVVVEVRSFLIWTFVHFYFITDIFPLFIAQLIESLTTCHARACTDNVSLVLNRNINFSCFKLLVFWFVVLGLCAYCWECSCSSVLSARVTLFYRRRFYGILFFAFSLSACVVHNCEVEDSVKLVTN